MRDGSAFDVSAIKTGQQQTGRLASRGVARFENSQNVKMIASLLFSAQRVLPVH